MKISIHNILLIAFLLVSSKTLSQTLIKENNQLFIEYNSNKFEVDTKVITVKFKSDASLYNITPLRANKLGYLDIEVPTNINMESFISSIRNNQDVLSVDYNSIGEYVSYDPDFSKQWYIGRINIEQAWNLVSADPKLAVGVLDSGLDYSHVDVGIGDIPNSYQNIYINHNEIPNNGIDDDNNGFVDDIQGWNFDNNSNDVKTTHYHGTFVAGIISAKTNNNIGIAGIAGQGSGHLSEGVKILPVCVGVNAPRTEIIDDAIIYAVDNGAKIIQFSLTVHETNAINAAIEYAKDNGITIICAAGNGNNNVTFPANNPNTIAIGAINESDQRAYFSNYGTNLDNVAPGVNIYSTSLNNTYEYSDGTSFSAPQVSGIAMLMLSANPFLTPVHIRSIINSTCTKLAGYTYSTDALHTYGTWNNETGYGLINAFQAISEAKNNLPDISITKKIRAPERPYFLDLIYELTGTEVSSKYSVEWSINYQGINEISSYEFTTLAENKYKLRVYPTYNYTPYFQLIGSIKDEKGNFIHSMIKPISSVAIGKYILVSGFVHNSIEIINSSKSLNQNQTNISTNSFVTANLYSMQNKVLSRSVNSMQEKVSIDVTNLPNGNYILNIVENNVIVLSESIIIAH